MSNSIPDRIKANSHWRVVFRPDDHLNEAIPTLTECRSVVTKNRVVLRGWDFPHVGSSANPDLHGIQNGNNWISGWSEFSSHLEYWRFYQSTQFIHLSTVRETREPQWRDKLQSTAQSHHSLLQIDWDSIPGFLGMVNFIYCVSEIAEFAARLTQAGIYEGHLNCTVELNNVDGFVLTPPWDRSWWDLCRATQPKLCNTWRFPADKLVGGSEDVATELCIWFFERLGWQNPNEEAIRNDVANFLGGNLR